MIKVPALRAGTAPMDINFYFESEVHTFIREGYRLFGYDHGDDLEQWAIDKAAWLSEVAEILGDSDE